VAPRLTGSHDLSVIPSSINQYSLSTPPLATQHSPLLPTPGSGFGEFGGEKSCEDGRIRSAEATAGVGGVQSSNQGHTIGWIFIQFLVDCQNYVLFRFQFI